MLVEEDDMLEFVGWRPVESGCEWITGDFYAGADHC
jgi:hypothetical protein